MPCHSFRGRDGATFIACGRSPLRDKRQRCAVCGNAWASRLCDGKDPGARKTCDAPLCDGCTVQTAPVIRLPDHTDRGEQLELMALKSQKRHNDTRRHLGEKRIELSPGADPLDYCPRHRDQAGAQPKGSP